MVKFVLPASPNWYCSKVTDSNTRGKFVFGARHDVYVFDIDLSQFLLDFKGAFSGHSEKVTAISLTDHEQHVSLCCSAAEDGSVKLWKLDSREEQAQHNIHSCKVTAVCWSMIQADLIVTGDENGTVGVWQFEDNRQSAHRPDKGSIFCMAASPGSAGVVAIGYKTGQILLLDVKKGGVVVMRLRGHDEEIHGLAWSPIPGEIFREPSQGTGATAGSQDITDLESFGVDDSWRQKPKTPSPSLPTKPAEGFGTEGWLLASGSRDRTVRIWSTSKGRQLLQMKLPPPGRKDRRDEGAKARIWLTVCWTRHSKTPTQLFSSSQGGDLLLWDISKTGKERCRSSQTMHSPGKGHARFIFNICPIVGDDLNLCTISMDRQIMFWNLEHNYLTGSYPTLGGYVYTMKANPDHLGHIALGVGDAMIRLWNLTHLPEEYDMVSYWQGIRSKVTALCWHPKKEGLLAYGTEDGRVGILDTLSKKPPQISTTYHRRTVYNVSWGTPSAYFTDDKSWTGYHVYSCGDGNILEHSPHKLNDEAQSINKLIQSTNPDYRCQTRVPTRSEICWTPDFTAIAVGNDDGTVEIYRPPDFRLVATVQVHHKLINNILWHPEVTIKSKNGSPYKNWLAIASNEFHVAVVDLTKVFECEEGGETLQITECLKRLEGHSNRVTCLAWSPHQDGLLASVSYDGNAIVWNVTDGSIQACYHGHLGKLLSVVWNGLDPQEILTGGDDFSIHRWRIADNPLQPGHLDMKKKKKKKNKAIKSDQLPSVNDDQSLVAMETTVVAMTTEDVDDITALLEQKTRELMAAEGTIIEDTANVEPTDTLPTEKGDNSTSKPERKEIFPTSSAGLAGKKKRKPKSMFPESSKKENRGKQFILDDIVTLATLIYNDQDRSSQPDDVAHLGLFLDRRATYTCLNIEGEHHRNNENMEYFYQLELWKGNINGVLRVARQRDELSDWLVAMAPMASYDTWTSVCEDYAIQLETDGQYHKAASYFLACHKVYDAIRLFKRHKLFKEAIALAKVRLSPLDPALEELYTLWAQQLTKDGNYEQAAKCHLAMKQVQDAAKLLARRYDQSSLRTAAHISMIANDKQQGLMYSQRVVQQHLLQHEWRETYSFLHGKKDLQVFLATSSIHEMLNVELTNLGILSVEDTNYTRWEDKKMQKILLPDFILDPGDVDSLSPWQPHLIQGHTFPHQILRTWYSHLDIAMDTTSLEDMYKTLCLLHAGRQTQVELNQVLIQICTDVTLCLLSLMMSETPTAMSHLLQAVGSLHEAGYHHIMHGLLRLFLPQGPKYILKLQQEVTAMRVMISMDTHSHVDGASKVHTIKRYLSDLKDENAISTGSLRCRELDCLRAYYYVAILNFLKESCESNSAEGTKSAGKKIITESVLYQKSVSNQNVNTGVGKAQSSDDTVEARLDVNGNANAGDTENGNSVAAVTADTAKVGEDKVKFVLDTNEDTEEKLESSGTQIEGIKAENNSDVKSEPSELSSDTVVTADKTVSEQTSQTSASSSSMSSHPLTSRSLSVPMLNVNYYSINLLQICQLSQGLLWDLQAKRFALTETLGYIHKAISQLLLSKNPKPSEASELATSDHPHKEHSELEPVFARNDSGGTSSVNVDTENQETRADSEVESTGVAMNSQSEIEGAVAMATTQTSNDKNKNNQNKSQSVLEDHEHPTLCDHHQHMHQGHVEGHICHSMLSHHFDHILNVNVPQGPAGDSVPLSASETEFKCSFFEVCSSCELLQKSRKILFEDEPHFQSRQESGLKNTTNIINPAKYINVPDEWYSMPVDQKYFKPYVTMAILKDEQEYVMHELKRGPDNTQSPFPSPLESVKPLLELGQHSSRITSVERKEYVQKVITWTLNFAVTTQQKQTYVNLLQAHMEC